MKQEIKTELYTSPEVNVIEIKAWQVMCSSVTDMGFGSDQNDGNFE